MLGLKYTYKPNPVYAKTLKITSHILCSHRLGEAVIFLILLRASFRHVALEKKQKILRISLQVIFY